MRMSAEICKYNMKTRRAKNGDAGESTAANECELPMLSSVLRCIVFASPSRSASHFAARVQLKSMHGEREWHRQRQRPLESNGFTHSDGGRASQRPGGSERERLQPSDRSRARGMRDQLRGRRAAALPIAQIRSADAHVRCLRHCGPQQARATRRLADAGRTLIIRGARSHSAARGRPIRLVSSGEKYPRKANI